MLQNKSTTIVSEIKDFFTSSEKTTNTILTVLGSLTLTEKQLGLQSKCNNAYMNIDKFLLAVLFPFFGIQTTWHYRGSSLYGAFGWGKDVFYRLLNNSSIPWRKISYRVSMQLIRKTSIKSNDTGNRRPRCLIVDDSDLPKTGRRIELVGKVFSHVANRSILAFKGLFMGYHDGKSFFALDFSLHGERGKNQKKPYGLTNKQLKERSSKHRSKNSMAYQRKEEYFTSKIQSMIGMARTAIAKGLRFDYVLVDSWFTCFELVKFVKTRRIGVHLLGMAKMGKTRYLFNGKKLTAREIADCQRKKRKLKRSKRLGSYYSEAVACFNGIPVKLFFNKASRKGKWHLLLATDLELNFEQAYRIYSTRWSIEVFFKEAKQYLGLGKSQSRDFDAQIATTTICMIQYNLLATAKRFTDYESLGELFRNTKAETIHLTVVERIWQIIVDILSALAELIEIDTEMLMEKLISDNERIKKLVDYKTLLQAG